MADKTGVLLFATALPPPVHGQSSVSASILASLIASGGDVKVVDTSPGSLKRSLAYHARKGRAVLSAIVAIIGGRRGRFRAVYTTVDAGAGAIYDIAIVAAARSRGLEIFLHHHTSAYLATGSFLHQILFALAGQRGHHVLLSTAMKEDLLRLYGERAICSVSHNASYVPEPPVAGESERRRLRIGMLSNLTFEKGLGVAIEAATKFRAKNMDVEFVFAGPVPGEAEAQMLARAAEAKILEYRGPLGGGEKREFFRGCDVFIFPTLYPHEAQPLVILEAMSYGAAIVTHDRGYIRELMGGVGSVVASSEDFSEVLALRVAEWMKDESKLRAEKERSLNRFRDLRAAAGEEREALIKALLG